MRDGYAVVSCHVERPLDDRVWSAFERLLAARPAGLRLPSGAELLELPATHSLGLLGRGLLRLPGLVHVHFHDWELVDRRRAAALQALLRLLRLRRRPLELSELAAHAATAPLSDWTKVTIGT